MALVASELDLNALAALYQVDDKKHLNTGVLVSLVMHEGRMSRNEAEAALYRLEAYGWVDDHAGTKASHNRRPARCWHLTQKALRYIDESRAEQLRLMLGSTS